MILNGFLSLQIVWVECFDISIFQTENTSKTMDFNPKSIQCCMIWGVPFRQRMWWSTSWLAEATLLNTSGRDDFARPRLKMWPAACWPWGAVIEGGTGWYFVFFLWRAQHVCNWCAHMQISAAICEYLPIHVQLMQMPTYFDRIWQWTIRDWCIEMSRRFSH